MGLRFLRQYIAVAKKFCEPKLTLPAATYLAEKYTELRAMDLDQLADDNLARVRPCLVSLQPIVKNCIGS